MAQSLSARLINHASRLSGRGPSGNMWDKIACRSLSEIRKCLSLVLAATLG